MSQTIASGEQGPSNHSEAMDEGRPVPGGMAAAVSGRPWRSGPQRVKPHRRAMAGKLGVVTFHLLRYVPFNLSDSFLVWINQAAPRQSRAEDCLSKHYSE